ncbi:MAG: hypothetical protein GY702_15465 [Desulfobulbaceae bacterium]|nr:hypothetical protein [Desulfobulbaceae bacterium]
MFKGTTLKFKVEEDSYHAVRSSLCNKILESFKSHFCDMNEGILQACDITSFANWPGHESKEKIRQFGKEYVDLITDHFLNVLQEAGVNLEEIQGEWASLKSELYLRYKDVQNLTFTFKNTFTFKKNMKIFWQ